MALHKGSENYKVNYAIAPATGTTVETTGQYVDMAKYNNYGAIVMNAATADFAGSVTCVIAESTDGTTWSNTYLATVTLSSSTTTPDIDTVECRAEEMSDGYRYLRPEITCSAGTGNMVAVINARWNSRYPAASLPS